MKYNKKIQELIEESEILELIDKHKKIKDLDAIQYNYFGMKYVEYDNSAFLNKNVYITFYDDSIIALFYGATYRETEVFSIVNIEDIDIENPEEIIENTDNEEIFELVKTYIETNELNEDVEIQDICDNIVDSLYMDFNSKIKINDIVEIKSFINEIIIEIEEKTDIKRKEIL